MTMQALSEREFGDFQRFIYEAAGIHLAPAKRALVAGRLRPRVARYDLDSYGDYFRLLSSGKAPGETQTAIDLLTTNETYFFREPKHFEVLRRVAEQARGKPFRVWSAASSSGEEPYSIAMVLADVLGDGSWDVLGSDISQRVLERARRGHYPIARTAHIPADYLKRFCLRGTGPQDGSLLVDRALRGRVTFSQINLNAPLPAIGSFDVIFLRNVMIYFNAETKRRIVARLLNQLKPGGLFLIGHSESLHLIDDSLEALAPAVYRKPGRGV